MWLTLATTKLSETYIYSCSVVSECSIPFREMATPEVCAY